MDVPGGEDAMHIRTLTLCGALIAVGAPASAQQFNDWISQRPEYTDDYRTSYIDARRIAYDNGYREGRNDGEHAVRDGKPFNLEREKDFRKADRGYHRNYGDKDRYRDNFRSGYAAGYREAYDRFGYNGGYYGGRTVPRRDRGWGYPSRYPQNYPTYPNGYPNAGYGYGADIAFQNGLNDGYEKGLDDLRHSRYPDYARQKWYRSGDHHYNGRYGSREAYKDLYRRGFQQGYDRAFREGRRW
jgi:flagellar biosynthesis/type III secretory pathway protein FliH